MMGLHGMRVGIAWLWYVNVDRGIFNGKQSKDQPKGDNWEAGDFSLYLRIIPLAGDVYCCTSNTWREREKREEKTDSSY